tara:strand:- start:1601 stop:1945 length:345 start_codon:yes stop_codon:yes gene_type:complete
MASFPTTVAPDFGFTKISKPKIRIAQFGSGYQQRSTFGINQNLKIYNFSFTNITETESDEIEDFLDLMAGVQSFTFTPPNELTSSKFICRDWEKTNPFADRATITATFEEVAEA